MKLGYVVSFFFYLILIGVSINSLVKLFEETTTFDEKIVKVEDTEKMKEFEEKLELEKQEIKRKAEEDQETDHRKTPNEKQNNVEKEGEEKVVEKNKINFNLFITMLFYDCKRQKSK